MTWLALRLRPTQQSPAQETNQRVPGNTADCCLIGSLMMSLNATTPLWTFFYK